MHNQDQLNELKTIVQSLLDEAQRLGASAAEAGLTRESGLAVTVRMGDVETIEHHSDQGLGVTVYFGQRKGSASTTQLTPSAIKETVAAACSIARYTQPDPFAGLPEPDRLATRFPELQLYHPWELSAETAIDLALECEGAARGVSLEISNSEGASVNTHQGIHVLGNSLGFLQGTMTTRHSLSCSILAQRNSAMQRDYWYSVARDPLALESAEIVGKKAAERALRRLGARPLTTRQCPVLFAAEIAPSLFGSFIGAISGGVLYRKSSFLLDSLGTSIFPEFLRIYECPHELGALGSAAFDSEGVATQAHDIVDRGIVQSYVLSSYSARKLGMATTGNAGGVHNLVIESGNLDFAGMLAKLDTGLLVTELMGQGVNMVTGDYSRGAAGFWVEKGCIQYPVEEITIAGNLKDMFKRIVAVGNDVDCRGNVRTGSVLIERMAIAGE